MATWLGQVQEEMVNEIWSDDTLRMQPCQREHGPNNEVMLLLLQTFMNLEK